MSRPIDQGAPLLARHHLLLGAAAVAALLAVVWIHWPLATDQSPVNRDLLAHYYPVARQHSDMLAAGHGAAGWNPLLNGGMPYAADPLNGALYPPNLIYKVVGDVPVAFAWLVFLHRLVLGGLTAWLAMQLGLSGWTGIVVGFVTCLGGALLSTDAVQYLFAYTWMPLYLGMLVRFGRGGRPLALGGAILALVLVLLASEPQTFYILVLITPLLYWGAVLDEAGGSTLRTRPWVTGILVAGIVGLAAAAIGAALLLPLRELSVYSNRPHVNSYEAATVWSFHPLRLIELFVAEPFGRPEPGAWTFWALPLVRSNFGGFYLQSHYVGVVAAGLAVAWPWLAPRRLRRLAWTLSAIGVLALLVGTGDVLDVYKPLYEFLPRWELFRFPERLLVHTLWPVALLVGMSLQGLGERALCRRFLARLGWAGAVGAGVLALAAGALPLERIAAACVPQETATAVTVIQATLVPALWRAALVLGLAAAWVGLAAWHPRLRPLVLPILVVGLALDLASANARLLEFAPNALLRQRPAVLTAIADQEDAADWHGPRLYSRLNILEAGGQPGTLEARWQQATRNTPLGWGQATVNGYTSLETKAVVDFVRAVPFERMAAVLGVGYVITTPADPWFAGAPPIAVEPSAAVYGTGPVRPIVHAVTRWSFVNGAEAARRQVATAGFDPLAQTVLVRSGTHETEAGGRHGTTPRPPVTLIERTPDRAHVRVDCADSTAVILGETTYPGWRVQVDGGAWRPPLVADGVVQATLVPPGRHEVVFEFRSATARRGRVVSWVALVLTVGALAVAEWRRRGYEAMK